MAVNTPASPAGPARPAFERGTAAVTGATGFIGGRLVERLAADGWELTCLIRGTDAGTRIHRAGARVRQLDIADAAAVQDALRGIDVVFHLAYDWGDAGWNLAALRALIAGCRANACRRLVHVSSFVVYQIPADGELSESTAPTTASGGYAHTKLVLEHELLDAVRDHGVPGTIVQPTIVYGPFSRPWTIDPADMLRHGTVVLPDAGEGVCNAVYVDDVVSALILAATRPEAVGQRYLATGPAPITFREFYEGIARAIGAKGPEFLPAETISRANTGTGKLLRVARDPERVIRRVAGIGPAGKLMRTALRALPHGLRRQATARLFGPATQRRGFVHLPDAAHLDFLRGRSTIRSAKARAELGYEPLFDFAAGLEHTAPFFKKAYPTPG